MINYILDTDEEIEIDSLLGEVIISDKTNSIHFKDTYVDTIIESLLKGITRLKSNNKVSVDLIEEPGELEFDLHENRLTITYKKHILCFEKSIFEDSLLLVIKKLIYEIKEIFGEKTNPIIENLSEKIVGDRRIHHK